MVFQMRTDQPTGMCRLAWLYISGKNYIIFYSSTKRVKSHELLRYILTRYGTYTGYKHVFESYHRKEIRQVRIFRFLSSYNINFTWIWFYDYIDNEIIWASYYFWCSLLYIILSTVVRYTPYTFEHRFYIPSTLTVFIFYRCRSQLFVYLAKNLHVCTRGEV